MNVFRLAPSTYRPEMLEFQLPGTADSENISASLKNGLLTLTVPKREEAKPRQIQVTAR